MNCPGTMATQRPSLSGSPVAAEWQRRIARELEAGEDFVWAGQPDPTMALVRYLYILAPTALFILLCLVFVTWLSWDDLRQGRAGALALLGLLLLALVGVAGAALWHRRR